jgi:hypothetical protein
MGGKASKKSAKVPTKVAVKRVAKPALLAASKWASSAARHCVLNHPGGSKHEEVRYLDIHEGDQLDEPQLAAWVKQASQLPGWGKS